ncbi:MAG: hypothetical protein DHS20C14_04210 [Phycisphaeraceae bacterium]|nr:MAG: hypothetical protein DHS20C14_04210 [Phycisphaeraceae bacterium]
MNDWECDQVLDGQSLDDYVDYYTHQVLGDGGVLFLANALGAIQRLLPHTTVRHKVIHIGFSDEESTYSVNEGDHQASDLLIRMPRVGCAVCATVSRHLTGRSIDEPSPLDTGELLILDIVASRIAKSLRPKTDDPLEEQSLSAIGSLVDEQVVSAWLKEKYEIGFDLLSTIAELRKLAEQTYENKSLSFGCIIDTAKKGLLRDRVFPEFLGDTKSHRALSDGFSTAYVISSDGCLLGFKDIRVYGSPRHLGKAHYPMWARNLVAQCTNQSTIAIALTKNGDIVVLNKDGLLLAYRFGQWQFWNHEHIRHVIHIESRVQRVGTASEPVAKQLYESALDVAFRRSGGLFVILRNREQIKFVRARDRIGNLSRDPAEIQLDEAIKAYGNVENIPRSVLADLAGLDGAIVVNSKGKILAYGAVLKIFDDDQSENVKIEGSRTKAARAVSAGRNIAIKASSDGDISVWSEGEPVMEIGGVS